MTRGLIMYWAGELRQAASEACAADSGLRQGLYDGALLDGMPAILRMPAMVGKPRAPIADSN